MIKFHVQHQPWDNRVHIGIAELEGGVLSVATALQMQVVKPGEVGPAPVLSLEPEDAQVLMDMLYGIGVRPTEGNGSVGQVAALKAHLDDMRRIVFSKKDDESWG